jgi:putative glutamine amidotransferase
MRRVPSTSFLLHGADDEELAARAAAGRLSSATMAAQASPIDARRATEGSHLVAERVPYVWVVSSHRELANEHGKAQPYTLVDEGGSRALVQFGLQPVCYPRVPAGRLPLFALSVEGVLLGGSATNVHPRHYGEDPARERMSFDEAREAVSLPLIRLCIDNRIPLIAFCRGSHEFNVAMGGSLHQDLKAHSGGVVHWEDPDETVEAQYAERHDVSLVPGEAISR